MATKVKVNKKAAEKKVRDTKNTAPVKLTPAEIEAKLEKAAKPEVARAAPAKAVVNRNQPMPEGVKLLQPPNGETVALGQTLQIGRKRYGGDYFGRLTAEKYELACKFMAAVLKAVKGSEGVVTPEKLCLNVPNAHGTPTRVFAIENSGGLQFHSRYFTQPMFDLCHKKGVQVFGNREKGQTVNGQEAKAPQKAHSNSIHLTPETLVLAVELSQLKAASL